MRNYWMRIVLGAMAIFTVGMIARSLITRGMGGVRSVVEGSGPISIPLAFIPFNLGGDKLGSLERVTLRRETPRRVTSIELEVELSDSVLARGLEGCRLAANFDDDSKGSDVNIEGDHFRHGNFWCAGDDSASAALVEYGHAVLRPGNVTVPLLLPPDLVNDLQNLELGDDPGPPPFEAEVESVVKADMEAELQAELRADSLRDLRRGMLDSLRAEGRRRADSANRVLTRMADSMRSR